MTECVLEFGILKMFKCDCCGLCCMNLKMSELYSDLDRGDGICRYFDNIPKLCSVYNDRPDKCNVDKMYEKFYKDKMTIEEYYELNYVVCNNFKMQGGK
jgi:Fe-S-cluster containining protein